MARRRESQGSEEKKEKVSDVEHESFAHPLHTPSKMSKDEKKLGI